MRRAFGIVFQDPSLDDELTAAENMELHGVLYGVKRAQRLERVEGLCTLSGCGSGGRTTSSASRAA